MLLRAAIYTRISEDRTGAGLGVKRQEDDCRALAEKEGFDVVGLYSDNDVSAYSGRPRPSYQALLQALEDGQIDVVICWHTDRLHRSPLELEHYIAACRSNAVRTFSVKGGLIDLTSPEGMLTAGLFGQLARYESAHKAARVRRAQEQKARDGGWLGGSRPFGWSITDGVPAIDEAEASVVRAAHSHVLAGYSLGSYIKELNAADIKTGQGNPWSYATLRQLLLRPRNAGLSTWEGEVVASSVFPALVERHIWEATRSLLTDPSRKRSTTNKVKHLLSGIAVCECLSPVRSAMATGRNGERYPIYRCVVGGPGHVNKRMSYVDEHVLRHVLWFFYNWRHRTELEGAAGSAPDVEGLRTHVSAYRERLDEGARLFAEGLITGEQLTTMSRSLHPKLTAAEAELSAHEQRTAATASLSMSEVDFDDPRFRDEWETWSVEKKRALIRERFFVVLHRHTTGSARVFDPGTVQIKIKASANEALTASHVNQWKEDQVVHPQRQPYMLQMDAEYATRPDTVN